jgi:ElaB/YqjD/DUF883 family membrane-anchored ribosome-binding protein
MANETKAEADIAALIGAMREDIAKLTEALAHALAAKGAEAGAAAREGLGHALERGRTAASKLKGEASAAAGSLEHAIEERPFASVLIALVLGFFAGALLRR